MGLLGKQFDQAGDSQRESKLTLQLIFNESLRPSFQNLSPRAESL